MDPVSFLDKGATPTEQLTLDPLVAHSYENFDVNIEKRGYEAKTDFVDLDQ